MPSDTVELHSPRRPVLESPLGPLDIGSIKDGAAWLSTRDDQVLTWKGRRISANPRYLVDADLALETRGGMTFYMENLEDLPAVEAKAVHEALRAAFEQRLRSDPPLVALLRAEEASSLCEHLGREIEAAREKIVAMERVKAHAETTLEGWLALLRPRADAPSP